ncbi:MAG: DUF5682 family protein [Meiothermus sp.]|nr:DUF5682 family protein [Meiothermus sp.]
MSVHIFGIRHHGPGSARSLKVALEALRPDCVLVEGPPEADPLLPLILHEQMQPPVALLVYASDHPAQASFYPFAEFSPEWQALRYGLAARVPTRFFDLPMTHRLGERRLAPPAPQAQEGSSDTPELVERSLPPDPLTTLAQAAGYDDFERWWNHLVEERRGEQVFEAILEAISALRENEQDGWGLPDDPTEQLREAAMRQNIRQAQKAGHQKIAVICGAWHTPALKAKPLADLQKSDVELLKGLDTTQVSATWVPWTFGRLSRFSGYGAGITSPGWYQHLWETHDRITERWMARIAGLLREKDLGGSPAQVIDAVRLADTLAAMRGRALPGLDEMNESAEATFAFGNPLVLRHIDEQLTIGERLGVVPDETPAAPVQQDLAREVKRLRLIQDAAVRDLELDLRKETDLARSRLFHRLRLLGIHWAKSAYASGKGTFKEAWQLKWEPEYAIALIEAGRYGSTVPEASSSKVMEAAQKADLPSLTQMLEDLLLAELPSASVALMQAIETQAAQATDVGVLMRAVLPLVRILRYGNVRQTDTQMVGHAVEGLVARICVGLPNACAAISDEAAAEMFGRIVELHGALQTLQDPEQSALWLETLGKLSNQVLGHGLVVGRAVRLLMEAGVYNADETARRLGLALSDPEPEKASGWLEGFLKGSGLILIHDDVLFGLLNNWLAGLHPEAFMRVLPLLRRTFSTFEAPERRSIGEKAKHTEAGAVVVPKGDSEIDHERGARVLPLLQMLLGTGDRL